MSSCIVAHNSYHLATVALVIHITIYCLLPCLSSEASPRVITYTLGRNASHSNKQGIY